ncbi:MAG: pyridoxal-phosphate dependent enzyme [Ruegeria sp.]
MKVSTNQHRGEGKLVTQAPYPSTNPDRLAQLLSLCPAAAETPLTDATSLAPVSRLWVKDERSRMNLGSFKALGAAYVIACQASEVAKRPDSTTLADRTYVTASAGNHGLSMAAGARIFGAQAVVFISETVPDSFAARLESQGARVVRAGADYAASMDAASEAARDNGWTLLSDSSWPEYYDLPHLLMEGYVQMAVEAVKQCPDRPTVILLQAGVGGMAGALAAYFRKSWGDTPKIVVVEPSAAPALQASIEAGKPVFADGPDSNMGRLDCKEPSLIALNGLARDADLFLTLDDEEVTAQLPAMAGSGIETTPSGGAGLATVLNPDARRAVGIGPEDRVLCIVTEQPS